MDNSAIWSPCCWISQYIGYCRPDWWKWHVEVLRPSTKTWPFLKLRNYCVDTFVQPAWLVFKQTREGMLQCRFFQATADFFAVRFSRSERIKPIERVEQKSLHILFNAIGNWYKHLPTCPLSPGFLKECFRTSTVRFGISFLTQVAERLSAFMKDNIDDFPKSGLALDTPLTVSPDFIDSFADFIGDLVVFFFLLVDDLK